jgi:hypothetical protein
MGSLSRSAHGLFYLCIQAEEGRRAPEAKIAKIIKETILLFSCHHPFHCCQINLFAFNTFYNLKSIEKVSLPSPGFSLPATRVNPFRGFIRPTLRLPGSRPAITLKPTPSFNLRQPNSEAVGPMKPLQGPTPIAGKN